MKANLKTLKMAGSTVLITVILILTSCMVVGERGNGKVSQQERQVPSFNSIDVSGSFDIILTQGATQSVIVEADENLMKFIRTEVKGRTLEIDQKEPIQHASCLKVHITVTDLKSIEASGAVDLESQGKLTFPEISISTSGASDTKLELDVAKLSVDCSGGSKLKFSGLATDTHMEISGAVDLFAYELVTENFNLEISGAGKAQINVSKKLSVDISGAGSVRYKGTPEKLSENISGAGSIKKAED